MIAADPVGLQKRSVEVGRGLRGFRVLGSGVLRCGKILGAVNIAQLVHRTQNLYNNLRNECRAQNAEVWELALARNATLQQLKSCKLSCCASTIID